MKSAKDLGKTIMFYFGLKENHHSLDKGLQFNR